MARPIRLNVDYFPFYCDEGEKMFYIEQTYGNDGFTVFVKLLRELAKKDNHYLNLNDESSKMFLSAKCRVSIEVLESIINDLVKLGKFNKELWEENSVIWCQDFIDSIQDAYAKRNNECITLEGLRLLLISLGVCKHGKSSQSTPVNPQSIVEDSIVKKSKIKNNDFLNFKNDIDFEKLLNVLKTECPFVSMDEIKKQHEIFCSKKEFAGDINLSYHDYVNHFMNLITKNEKDKRNKNHAGEDGNRPNVNNLSTSWE